MNDRIGALVSEHGIPPGAREAFVALAGAVETLREREATVGDREQREAVAAERRAVSKQTREVLESLTPSYRAAMRRSRISVRQLAAWAADHPAD